MNHLYRCFVLILFYTLGLSNGYAQDAQGHPQNLSDDSIMAARGGDIEKLKLLLGAAPDLPIRADGRMGQTLLHHAAFAGQVETVDWLLAQGAAVNAGDRQGSTALILAILAKQTAVVSRLLVAGADPDLANMTGMGPLHYAVSRRLTEVCDLLLAKKAAINAAAGDGTTPVMLAFPDLPLMTELIRQGADPTAGDRSGLTLLHRAALQGDVHVLDALLERYTDPDPLDRWGRSPLLLAAAAGYQDIVDKLLRRGADARIRDKQSRSSADLARGHGHQRLAERLDGLDKDTLSTAALLAPLPAGQWRVVYLGHSGWAIRTAGRLLVFDPLDYDPDPGEPGLANGRLIPDQLSGLDTTFFISHAHADHWDQKLLARFGSRPNVRFVYGWKPDPLPSGNAIVLEGSRQTIDLGGITVTSIRAEDGGSAMLVSSDGLNLYFGGDYTGAVEDDMAFLAAQGKTVDLAFIEQQILPVTLATMDKLRPRFMFPMHAPAGRETVYRNFADAHSERFPGTRILAAEFRGDRFASGDSDAGSSTPPPRTGKENTSK